MPITLTTSGYIEVYREGVFISRHTVETKAVESALAHAEENGDGDYELRFPKKTLMSRLRKTQLPFRWLSFTLNWTQGTAGPSVNLSTYVNNPENRTLTYSVVGSLPSGVTLNGSTLSYNGSGAAIQTTAQFRITDGTYTAESAATPLTVVAVQTNTPPSWTTAANLGSVVAGQSFNFPLTATDAQNDTINFIYANPAFGSAAQGTQSGGTRTLVWSGTAPTTPGTYTFVVDAVDVPPLGQVIATATAGANQITLAWASVNNATSYEVQRSASGSSGWSALATVSTTSHVDTSLLEGATWYYRVRAINATQQGEYSPAVVATALGTPSGDRFEFADIPEIVFLEGFAEDEEMGIFFLDPTNRTRPGDLSQLAGGRIQRHPVHGGGNYAPRSGIALVSVSGSASGVTYEASTGRIRYSGATQSDSRARWSVKFTGPGGKEASFDIRVMRPQVVYGTNASAVNTAKGWGAVVAATTAEISSALVEAGTENVVAILGGTYTDANWTGSTPREILYVLGEPYNRPHWIATGSADSISANSCQIAYYKNLKGQNTSFTPTHTDAQVMSDFGIRYTVYNCEQVDWTAGADAMANSNYGGAQTAYCRGPYKFYCVNFFGRKGGGGNLTHLMYIHGRPNSYLNVNNAKIYGGRSGSQIKTIMKHNFVLNSYLHTITVAAALPDGNFPSPSAADLTASNSRCQETLNIHGFCHAVVYNDDFMVAYNATQGGTQHGAIHVQWRGYEFIGGDEPMAPDHSFWHYTRNGTPLPLNLLNSCGYGTETISSERWPVGGTPAYPALPTAPELGTWANTGNTYMDPDFWDEIRAWGGATDVDAALADPTNPYTYKRYVSHCRFTWLQQGTENRKPWIKDDGWTAGGQYSTTQNHVGVLHPTTENWTHRSATFSLNNQFSGWTDADSTYPQGERWEDGTRDYYGGALTQTQTSPVQTQLYGPFGTITRDGAGDYVSSTGQTITINDRNGVPKDVFVNATPTVESGRPRYITHVGGDTGPTVITDPSGSAAVPAWFKLGYTG
jgi:hypothetical protein